jgi:hypothetical protein
MTTWMSLTAVRSEHDRIDDHSQCSWIEERPHGRDAPLDGLVEHRGIDGLLRFLGILGSAE